MGMDKLCNVELCKKPSWCRGMCTTHYWRWHRHGDPHFVALRGRTGGSTLRYLTCRVGVVEKHVHRLVWEEWNGPVPKGYCIHHINGDRYDNTLENLAIMTVSEHGRLHQTQ
jgi:hypothetical protein